MVHHTVCDGLVRPQEEITVRVSLHLCVGLNWIATKNMPNVDQHNIDANVDQVLIFSNGSSKLGSKT
jgi:hypothetical protein